MKIERTLDVGFCLKVLTIPQIFKDISEDNLTFDDIKIDVMKEYWLKITDDGIDVGVVQLKAMFTNCWDLHIHIIPDKRKQYSNHAGVAIDEWLSENMKNCLICAHIPVIHENVIKFTEGFGFKFTGKLKGAWLKNGVHNDMNIYTRSY